MSQSLAEHFQQKTNSIGFLRVALATTVIVHHSFTLRHEWTSDPLWRLTSQLDSGSLAVDSFLVLSGFLIAASFEKTSSLPRYLWHRALRLYPAFWMCLLVSSVLFAPLAWIIERGSLSGYFASSGGSAIEYVVSNSTLWIRQTEIASLFQAHSSHYFNGSLWTLSLEATCYLLMPFVAYAGASRKQRWLVLLGWTMLCGWFVVDLIGFRPRMFSLAKVGIYFATGVLFYVYRDLIPLNSTLLLLALALIVVSVALHFAGAACLIIVPYAVLWCAFKLPFTNWERTVDLSYGMYVYAYPIQQLLLSAWPNIHSLVLLLLTVAAVTPVAFLSWTFVERPALKLKHANLALFREPALKATSGD